VSHSSGMPIAPQFAGSLLDKVNNSLIWMEPPALPPPGHAMAANARAFGWCDGEVPLGGKAQTNQQTVSALAERNSTGSS